MSNELSIAAVTMTVRNLLEPVKELSDSSVNGTFPSEARPSAEVLITNVSLDEAFDTNKDKNQVNIFLYHIENNAAWRNMDVPGKVKNGETSKPPLGITLYYIITAYGQDKNEIIGHLLLGKVMSILHDHPVFSKQEIETAFPESHLHEQTERVRITSQPISLDEVAKLWSGFQTQYKLSVAYQVSVILIESKRPSKTPLPVLARGAGDTGVSLHPYIIPPYPTLQSIVFPRMQTGVQPGDELVIKGHHLKGDTVSIFFRHPVTGIEISRPVPGASEDGTVKFTIPNAEPGNWPPGLYTTRVIIHQAGKPDKKSNDISFMLLPVINTKALLPLSPPEPRGFLATISFAPEVKPQQKVALLFGDREFIAKDHPVSTNTLTFEMRNVLPGDYFIRLRVDGADSVLIIDTVTPPVFDPALKITVP
jgi:hypothetical protein